MFDRQAFTGLKVLEVSRVLASPFAGYQLALLGAEVIKIEDPGRGDQIRYRLYNRPDLSRSGMATAFLSQNANKKSLTLNLRAPEGQEIFKEMARSADVVIENLRAGTMARYGLGYDDLRALNPRLVYCSVTGYGQTGSKRRHPSYDPVAQAASGMMSFNGTPETAPQKVGAPVTDYATGLSAVCGIAIALFQREQTGRGQHVDVSMLDAALTLMGSVVTDVLTAGRAPKPSGNKNRSAENYTNGTFSCADGLLAIAAQEPHQRERLWVTIGRPDIMHDERFATPEACARNIDALHRELELALAARPAQEWEPMLNDAGVAAMRVRTLPEVLDEDFVKQRGFLHTFEKIEGIEGKVTIPLAPYKLSDGPARASSPPPFLGQHTAEVLETLGLSNERVAELRKHGVI
jgi:crotonobetainyl-CoA:carnitine CoA-transferase CaiB-like acyl-CoA transferase